MVNPVCSPAQESLSEKGSALKGKNLLPTRSKFFPFRVDPFSEGRQNCSGSYFP